MDKGEEIATRQIKQLVLFERLHHTALFFIIRLLI